MLYRLLPVALLLTALAAAPVFASDETTPEATATTASEAAALLEAGKLVEARDAYLAAAKADPMNETVAAQAMILNRVINIQEFVATEDPSPKWEKGVMALHVFFLSSDLHSHALKTAQAAHEKADTALTGSMVGETLLEMGQNERAAAFLDGLREGQKDDQNMVFHGIALARLGRQAEVRENVETYGVPKTTDPNLLFDVARLQALLGDHEPAMTTLTTCFENCPPRSMPALKKLANTNPDFEGLRKMDGFAKVLETKSSVKASGGCGCGATGGCPSGGGDCEGCPKSDGAEKEGGCCGSCGGK